MLYGLELMFISFVLILMLTGIAMLIDKNWKQ